MKVTAIVQARMGSSRLPGKMMMTLLEIPMIEWVLRRVLSAKAVSNVVLATSVSPSNDELAAIAKKLNCLTVRGDENDVLSRFFRAAEIATANHYVRVCADNPLICPLHIDELIRFHLKGQYDYSFNHIPKLNNGFSDGMGAEIMSARTLKTLAEKNPLLNADCREHVTKYIWDHPENFTVGMPIASPPWNRPELKFDVDTLQDFEHLKVIVCHLKIDSTSTEIFRVLDTHKRG